MLLVDLPRLLLEVLFLAATAFAVSDSTLAPLTAALETAMEKIEDIDSLAGDVQAQQRYRQFTTVAVAVAALEGVERERGDLDAVLSEVSPPTALSPFAAAAITGGDPYKTTLQCWKYTAPAFLVPFMFVLDPNGTGLLLTGSIKTLGKADWGSIALVTFTAAIGIAALAGGLQGWLLKRTAYAERWMLLAAGFALVYPTVTSDIVGFALVALVVVLQLLRRGAPGARPAS